MYFSATVFYFQDNVIKPCFVKSLKNRHTFDDKEEQNIRIFTTYLKYVTWTYS